MKKFTPLAIAALMTVPTIGLADGTSAPLDQDMLDKAGWTPWHGKDEVTGSDVHTLYTAKFGTTHFGISTGAGDLAVYDKRDFRVALVAAADEIGLNITWVDKK